MKKVPEKQDSELHDSAVALDSSFSELLELCFSVRTTSSQRRTAEVKYQKAWDRFHKAIAELRGKV